LKFGNPDKLFELLSQKPGFLVCGWTFTRYLSSLCSSDLRGCYGVLRRFALACRSPRVGNDGIEFYKGYSPDPVEQ